MATFRRSLSRLERVRLLIRDHADIRRLAGLVTRNFWLRLLSLLLALAAWAYVQKTTNMQVVELPVKVVVDAGSENLQAQAFTTNSLPLTNAILSVVCTPRDALGLRESDYRIKVNLTETAENTIPSYPLVPDEHVEYDGPEENRGLYTIQGIDPGRIRIVIDRSLQRLLPVAARTVGTPAENYEISKITVTPSAVMVRGPARIVEQLVSIPTEPVNIEGASKPVVLDRIRLVPTNSAVEVVNQPWVAVNVGVNVKPIQRSFSGIPLNAMGTPRANAAAALSPGTVTVVLQANQDIMDTIDPRSIVAYVDFRDLVTGTFNLPVKVQPPPNSELVEVTPPTATARVSPFAEE